MVEPKEALLRNVITHATGGNCTGEGMGLNDICVSISAHRNEVYARGVERGKATLAAENAALREKLADREWRPIETAPRDGTPILAWCHYGCSDPKCPYSDEDYMPSDAWRKTLCVFHAHAEGLSQVEEGLQVVVWGGGWVDGWEDGGGSLPDWWFRYGSEFEEAANPTHWMPLPEPPTLTGGDNAEE